MKHKHWTLIDWDGNPALNLKCWRKSFGKGHISVGVGDFMLVVHSFGPNSDKSFSSTRWRKNGKHLTEQEAMKLADERRGE
jgi:hypothetical protein